MNYKYTINPKADKPIMLINKAIGGENGINGADFQSELLYLDSLNKESIEIHINSVGGVISDGWNIFSGIISSKTPVNTTCVGLCASTASWLFQAGNERKMMDYGILMMHNPHGNGESKVLELFKNSIVKMTSSRSGINENAISDMMDAETWVNAENAKIMGLCSDVITTKKADKPILSNSFEAFEQAYNFVNQLIKPINQNMDYSKLCNRLGIVENSNEESILRAFDFALENSAKKSVEFENKAKELEATNEALKTKLEEFGNKAKEQAEYLAISLVEKFTNRITAESKENWISKAKQDLTGTEELLNSIPVNVVGVVIEDVVKPTVSDDSDFARLQEIKNKLANK